MTVESALYFDYYVNLCITFHSMQCPNSTGKRKAYPRRKECGCWCTVPRTHCIGCRCMVIRTQHPKLDRVVGDIGCSSMNIKAVNDSIQENPE
jgi:hypothetical protein